MNTYHNNSKSFHFSMALAIAGLLALPLAGSGWLMNHSPYPASGEEEIDWTLADRDGTQEEEVDWTLAENKAEEDETDWTLAKKDEAQEDEVDWTLAKNDTEEDETDWTLA